MASPRRQPSASPEREPEPLHVRAIDDLVPRDLIDLQLELPGAQRVTVAELPGDVRAPADGSGFDPATLALPDPMPGGIRECNNHCEFCFIRGLPKGLRPSLYVYDDDYRYSFLWGNFLTLTNLTEDDWARIGYQRLSPLNVSVHATDPDLRRRLLNNRHAPPILPQLDRLGRLGIEVHTQIVLCAGLNDGAALDESLRELGARFPTVRSVSVVPVGLTRFSKVHNVRRPTPTEAAQALAQCETWQHRLRASLGTGVVYGSDELYLLAGRTSLPPAAAYDGFPVLANGVGLLRSMIDDWGARLRRLRTAPPPPRQVVLVTGRSAEPALSAMAEAWAAHAGWRPEVRVVSNDFFGSDISVSGLLTGADLVRTLHELPPGVDDVILPRGPFGFDGKTTLDGVDVETVGAAHPGRVHIAATPAEVLAILRQRP
jgi:putative radical SAM enzyme (TIGR03279 family)